MRTVGALALLLVIAIVAGCGGSDSSDAVSRGGEPSAPVAATPAEPVPVPSEPAPVVEPIVLPSEVRKAQAVRDFFFLPGTALDALARAHVCQAGEIRKLRTPFEAPVAIAIGRTRSYKRPGANVTHLFEVANANDFPTMFGVLAAQVDRACDPTWYRVQLPVKPNGSVGWVKASDVQIETITTRIEIDLSERQILLFDEGEKVLTLTAAIGAPGTPTPTGNYYVNQRLRTTSPDGPFGPGAIGISAFSDVLQGWAQGGPIAIHGTNQPGSIGLAASYGCLRVSNEEVELLFDLVPAGTPVEIRA